MKRIIVSLSVVLLFSFSLCGCGTKEEPPLIAVDSEDEAISYSLVEASYADVVKTQKVDCSYSQSKQQDISFDTTGGFVEKVYVRKGDVVKKGDLLCQLSAGSLQEEIDKLTYNITRNEMLLGYMDTDENLDIQDLWVNYSGAMPEDKIKEQVEGVQKNYARQRELLNDSLEFDRKELNAKKTQLKNSKIYAKIDGTVYKVKQYLEGSTSKEGEVVITIVDNNDCYFVVKDTKYKDIFSEGQKIDMRITYSTAAGEYILEPLNMDKWDTEMYFSVYSSPDEGADPEVGVIGTMSVVMDSKSNVLSIPTDVLHIAGDTQYVYTLSENGFREIRYVKVGLIGDERAEILDGLTEGEKVVKK